MIDTVLSSSSQRTFLQNLSPNPNADDLSWCLLASAQGYGIRPKTDSFHQKTTSSDFADIETYATEIGLQVQAQWLTPEQFTALLEGNQPFLVQIQPTDQAPHWVLVWNHMAVFHQVASYDAGIKWMPRAQLREWAITPQATLDTLPFDASGLLKHLQERATHIGIRLNQTDIADTQSILKIDAILRFIEQLIHRRAIDIGQECMTVFEHYRDALADYTGDPRNLIPAQHWVLDEQSITQQGYTVILIDAPATASAELPPEEGNRFDYLWQSLNKGFNWFTGDNRPLVWVVLIALIGAGLGVAFQAILLRSISGLGLILADQNQRLWAITLMILFIATVGVLRWLSQLALINIGQSLDGRLRMALLLLLPGIGAQFFRRYIIGDLYERIVNIRSVRQLLPYTAEFLILLFELMFGVLGLFLIAPLLGVIALIRLALTVFVTIANQFMQLSQKYARHDLGRLTHFQLDQLNGQATAQSHQAQQAVTHEYENRLHQWAKSQLQVLNTELWFSSITRTISNLLITVIIVLYIVGNGSPQNWLLVLFWSVNLDLIGNQLMEIAFYFWRDNAKINRYDDLLAGKPIDLIANENEPVAQSKGVHLQFEAVQVKQADKVILQDVNMEIQAGEHVALAGVSGAGKSTLLGLLLGYYMPSMGHITLDGKDLQPSVLRQIHQHTAWISPDVHLWRDNILNNVSYSGQALDLRDLIASADLRELLERTPQGWQSEIGEDGKLLSGGEGQQLRIARALRIPDVRLVLLDEPFRGLGMEARQQLLTRLRQHWADATMIFVSHDINLCHTFDRVFVMQAGKIVEAGQPQALANQDGTAYKQIYESYAVMRETVWRGSEWIKWTLRDGKIVVDDANTDGK